MKTPTRRSAESDRQRHAPNGVAQTASAGVCDFSMYGLRVRSAIDLSEWPLHRAGEEPEVLILAEPDMHARSDGVMYGARSVIEDREVRLQVHGVAQYTASGGSCIRVAAEPGARPEDVRLYLTGAMLGVILHQRGILPLHASCVAVEGSGVAFAAASGGGKSTLVGALLRRGAAFVTDDICVMTEICAGQTGVWPGALRLKLDAPGMAALDSECTGLEPAGGNRGKYHVPVSTSATPTDPVPLSCVYLLEFGEGEPRVEELRGLEAISALVDETYLLAFASDMGLSTAIFRKAAELSRTVTVKRLIRPRGFEHLDAVLDLIERDAGGFGGKRSKKNPDA